MLQRIYALIIKEFLAVWRDKRSRLALVMPPILQLCIFAFAATLDVKNVSIGILNQDNGEQSRELIERFEGSPTFTKITRLQSEKEIKPFIDNQKGLMVVYFDEQFSRNLDANKHADIELILDGRKSNTTQIVAGYASSIISTYNDDISAKKNITQQNTRLIPHTWYNPNFLYYWYNVPCLTAVLTLTVAMIITALSIAREREMGTFDQLLVSPLRPIEILIGKSIPAIIIALVEGYIIVFVGVEIFGVPFEGSLFVLSLCLLLFIIAIVGVGLFISSLCNTQQQAILGAFTFMVPAITLSGFATPIENMPTWMQYITYINPVRYILVVNKGIFLKDMPLSDVVLAIWPLFFIAAFTLTGAAYFFRRGLS